MTTRRPWIVLAVSLFISACISQASVTETTVVVESTGTFVISTATPDCLHAEGVTLEIRRISDTKVTLLISGLQPGEAPYITYYASQGGSSRGGASGFSVKGADAQGKFSADLGLLPPDGYASAIWDIRVIHSRGLECATVTLP